MLHHDSVVCEQFISSESLLKLGSDSEQVVKDLSDFLVNVVLGVATHIELRHDLRDFNLLLEVNFPKVRRKTVSVLVKGSGGRHIKIH